jgi:hypothetical protein
MSPPVGIVRNVLRVAGVDADAADAADAAGILPLIRIRYPPDIPIQESQCPPCQQAKRRPAHPEKNPNNSQKFHRQRSRLVHTQQTTGPGQPGPGGARTSLEIQTTGARLRRGVESARCLRPATLLSVSAWAGRAGSGRRCAGR